MAKVNIKNERVKRKIYSRFIYTSQRGPILKTDKKALREVRFISPKRLAIKFDFVVFDDKVKLETFHGKLGGLIIQNKDIAQSFTNLFDFYNMIF